MIVSSVPPPISMDVRDPNAIPYFNWDAAITNQDVRRVLAEGTLPERLFWMARIMTEARYADVWEYVSLHKDILPNLESLLPMLGRRREFWAHLIRQWRMHELV